MSSVEIRSNAVVKNRGYAEHAAGGGPILGRGVAKRGDQFGAPLNLRGGLQQWHAAGENVSDEAIIFGVEDEGRGDNVLDAHAGYGRRFGLCVSGDVVAAPRSWRR